MNHNLIPLDEDGLILATGRAAVEAVLRSAGAEVLERSSGARAVLARAMGLAMTGKRVAVILQGQALDEALPAVADAVKRGIPFVIHAVCDCHAAYHRLAETGAFAVFARDAQQAVDLALVAQRVAELTLLPAIVAQDGPETADAPASLYLPAADLIASLLVDPALEVGSPTPAQDFLFGRSRPRIPRWFDMDRAIASGWDMAAGDRAAALAGRRLFYADHLAEIAAETMASVAAATGRHLSFTSNDHVTGARIVLVAQGAALAVAEAAARYLRTTNGWKAGVLGITAMHPLAGDQIRIALEKARVVAVLECPSGTMAEGPLYRELVSLAPKAALVYPAWRDTGLDLSAAQLAALFKAAREGAGDRVFLGLTAPAESTPFPKQELVFQALRRKYPQMDQSVLSPREHLDLSPPGAFRLVLFGAEAELTDAALLATAEALAIASGRFIRSAVRCVGAGIRAATLTARAESFSDPGAADSAEMVLATRLDLPLNPVTRLKSGGRLVIASLDTPETTAALLPESWRATLTRKGGKVVLFPGSAAELIAAVSSLIGSDDLLALPLADSAVADPGSGNPPSFMRDGQSQQDYGSLPRFWGEVLQPRVAGTAGAVPDPRLALGNLPAGSATITNRTRGRSAKPVFKPSACSGCGDCWLACPDSAIGTVAATTLQLLDAAAEAAGDGGKREVFGRLKRAHKNLASRLDTNLAKSCAGVLDSELLNEGFAWLMTRLKLDEPTQAEFRTVFEGTCRELLSLPVAVTQKLFHEPHANTKGSGTPLVLAVDPARCQGCGICAEVCPENALSREPRLLSAETDSVVTWRRFEALPDTEGPVVARLRSSLGPMAANFLSRCCAQALPGGGDSEPGSGSRLALRLLCGTAEYRAQHEMAHYAAELSDLADRLRQKVKRLVTEALPVTDLEALEKVLSAMPAHRAALKDVIGGLDVVGVKSSLDARKITHLVALAREMEDLHGMLTRGRSGGGRARYGLVLAAATAGEMTHYPHNPFLVPVVADAGGHGPELALGLLEGLMADHLAETKRVRFAETALKTGPQAAKQQDRAALAWDDLSLVERDRCPRVLLVLDSLALRGPGFVGLGKVLNSGRPIKVLVLDGLAKPGHDFDPLALALAHPESFVLSSSLARPDHLGPLLEQALARRGPALLHIYAPNPLRHGFASDQTLALAGHAVAAGVQSLFCYDPEREGPFGTRLLVAAEPETPAMEPTGLAEWASAQERFAKPSPSYNLERATRACNQRRAILRELSGLDSPFSARIRAELEFEFEADYAARQAELEAGFRLEQERLEKQRRESLSIQLSQRLLDMANQADNGGGFS